MRKKPDGYIDSKEGKIPITFLDYDKTYRRFIVIRDDRRKVYSVPICYVTFSQGFTLPRREE